MKIIFLDIDGVLNVISQGHDEFGSVFHPHLVENLRLIIEKTDAKIVISSSWRKNGLAEMQAMWKHRNLPGEVIDVTPSLYIQKGGGIQFWNDKLSRHPTEKVHGYSIPRGCEIEYWLNSAYINWDVESYVILDDDVDMLLSQKNKFVQCSGNIDEEDCVDIGYGLTLNCAHKAIAILNKSTSTLPDEYEYEMFFSSEEGELCRLDGWYPITKERLKHPDKIDDYIKKGILRKIIK